jgi:hypothetical protein
MIPWIVPARGVYFFFQFCEFGGVVIIDRQEDLAKFGYMSKRRVNKKKQGIINTLALPIDKTSLNPVPNA